MTPVVRVFARGDRVEVMQTTTMEQRGLANMKGRVLDAQFVDGRQMCVVELSDTWSPAVARKRQVVIPSSSLRRTK